MTRNFLKKPVIIGENVILRPFKDKDCDTMIAILDEPNLKKLTGSVSNDEEANELSNPDENDQIRQWYMTRNDKNDRLDLAVIFKETDQLIGEVVFNEYDEDTGNINFRVLLSESNCNKGLGTEAISLFIRYGMDELKLHKIGLEVYSFNTRAERVYKKVGFILEGIRREEFLFNQEYIDIKLYGLLKKDYQ